MVYCGVSVGVDKSKLGKSLILSLNTSVIIDFPWYYLLNNNNTLLYDFIT